MQTTANNEVTLITECHPFPQKLRRLPHASLNSSVAAEDEIRGIMGAKIGGEKMIEVGRLYDHLHITPLRLTLEPR
jgi:hypothetical protein